MNEKVYCPIIYTNTIHYAWNNKVNSQDAFCLEYSLL